MTTRTRKRSLYLASVIVLVLGSGAWYQFVSDRVPPGQAPLRSISRAPFQPLVQEFNRESNEVRVVLLLSPT
jgi:hypothetical protein